MSERESLLLHGPHADADWSTATVKVTVKVYGTAGETTQEVDVPLSALAAFVTEKEQPPVHFYHSWPTCPGCGRPHDSNGIGCPPWTPPETMESTPHRVACPTCEREQFVWTDGRNYFCGYCGSDLGTVASAVTT
jgi:hypothetical protein